MDFDPTPRSRDYTERARRFLEERVLPVEPAYHRELAARADRWVVLPVVDELKAAARAEGLWNLFLPEHSPAPASERGR